MEALDANPTRSGASNYIPALGGLRASLLQLRTWTGYIAPGGYWYQVTTNISMSIEFRNSFAVHISRSSAIETGWIIAQDQ